MLHHGRAYVLREHVLHVLLPVAIGCVVLPCVLDGRTLDGLERSTLLRRLRSIECQYAAGDPTVILEPFLIDDCLDEAQEIVEMAYGLCPGQLLGRFLLSGGRMQAGEIEFRPMRDFRPMVQERME